jgi:hypothetical protein
LAYQVAVRLSESIEARQGIPVRRK